MHSLATLDGLGEVELNANASNSIEVDIEDDAPAIQPKNVGFR